MLLLVVFGGGCDVRNPQPMDAEYCNCNWQMDAVYKHEHDEHESWWHHLRCNIPSTTLPWPLHAKSITAQTKCVHMPLVGGFVANIDVQLHHIVILQNTTSTRPYNLGLNLGHAGPVWKSLQIFFKSPYNHTMSYNIWLVVSTYLSEKWWS